jgi:hypothetical protein
LAGAVRRTGLALGATTAPNFVTYATNFAAPISFGVASDGRYFSYTIPAGAMTTFVWH